MKKYKYNGGQGRGRVVQYHHQTKYTNTNITVDQVEAEKIIIIINKRCKITNITMNQVKDK